MNVKTTSEEISASNKENYVLVEGKFDPEEACEIVNTLFTKKINFHELKCFSDEIRFGAKDQVAEDRVEQLKLSRENAKLLFEKAKESGKSIRLHSEISIELV